MTTITLNCLVLGDSPPLDHVIGVKVAVTSTVDEVRKEIYLVKPEYSNVNYDRLKLYKLKQPISTENENQFNATIDGMNLNSLSGQDLVEKLNPTKSVTGVGLSQPPGEHLHILVQVNHPDKEERKDIVSQLSQIMLDSYKTIVSTKGKSPSEGAKSTGYSKVQVESGEAIFDGLYPPQFDVSRVAPPIQIFHPIFGAFIHLVHDPDVQPSDEDLLNVQEFMHHLSGVGDGESSRNEQIRRRLRKILDQDIHEERNADGTSADAVCMLQVGDCRISLLIAEFKRILGEDGCDPSIQAGITCRRTWIEESRRDIREKTCCPTLIIAGGGAWLSVLGAVFTDKVIVQRLTDMTWVGLSSTEEDARVYHFARILVALRKSLNKLSTFYMDVANAGIPTLSQTGPHPRFFPHATTFSRDGRTFHFRYLTALEDDDACVTYLAMMLDENSQDAGEKVVVKFVAKYGERVHRFLAEQAHAPALRYYGSIPIPDAPQFESSLGPTEKARPGLALGFERIRMVVMNYVETSRPPENAHEQVREVLLKLHSEGYVFGDLRRPNILFDPKGIVKFIDFNWCGRYDARIQDKGLPDGVQEQIDDRKERFEDVGQSYACYPLALSRMIDWPDGMGALKPIRPIHDWNLLQKLHFE